MTPPSFRSGVAPFHSGAASFRSGPGSFRTGQGTVIIIAALFICVMAVMQVAQSYLLTQIGDQTARASLGRMCGLVAESAIDEARLVMATRVDDRNDPLFDEIRKKGPGAAIGTRLGGVDLKLENLPRLSRLLATETGKMVELLEPLTVELQAARALTLVDPTEIEGVVVYKVRTRSKLDKSIVREVEETQGFKMGRIALPPPLPKSPFYVRDPYRMIFGKKSGDSSPVVGTDVNNMRTLILDQHLPGLRTKYQEVMREFETGDLKDRAFVRDQLKPLYAKIGNDAGVDHIAAVEKYRPAVRPYDAATNGIVPYFLVANADTVDLERLNLQFRLAKILEELPKTVQEIERLAPIVQQSVKDKEEASGLPKHVEYTRLMLLELKMLEDALNQLAIVQSTMSEFKLSENPAAFSYMQSAFGTVEPLSMTMPFNVMAQRSFWRIGEEPGSTIQQQWERLKKRLDTFGAGFCGAVYVDNPNQILTLTGELSGNLVISVAGKLIVDGLKAKYAPDTLTVVSRGGDPGAVKLSGTITASVATRGSALLMMPGTVVVGSLILDEIPLSLTADPTAGGLMGTVTVDKRLEDTNKPQFYYVALSPWMRSRNTLRY